MSSTAKDEFEKRMYLNSFITLLADTVTKMNPLTLIPDASRTIIEAAGLKDQFQAAVKKWLDMLMAYIDKANKLGIQYPIEAILGIEGAEQKNP
jgi:hypothetical protein